MKPIIAPVTARSVLLGANCTVGAVAVVTVVRATDGSPFESCGARSRTASASESTTALAMSAARCGSVSTAEMLRMTVLSSTSDVIIPCSLGSGRSSPSSSITGLRTEGVRASRAYDCIRLAVYCVPCTSSLTVSPRCEETKALASARYCSGWSRP